MYRYTETANIDSMLSKWKYIRITIKYTNNKLLLYYIYLYIIDVDYLF